MRWRVDGRYSCDRRRIYEICESDLGRFLVFEQERETYGNGSIADDTASGLIERKRETREKSHTREIERGPLMLL